VAILQVNWDPDRRTLRQFGLLCLAVFGLIGAWIQWRHSFLFWDMNAGTAERTSFVLWAVAGACGLATFAAPRALHALHTGLTLVALPIGFVISHVLLGFLFYGMFSFIGLIFRLIRRDPLTRTLERGSGTYWVPRQPVTDMRQYYRQY
jgi:hypothetical protein